MNTSFAVVLRPDEAALLVEDWPDGVWLVAVQDGPERRWEAGSEAEVVSATAALPVWPPSSPLETGEIDAEAEIDLIRHLVAIPGLSAMASARLVTVERDDGPSAADIDWG